MDNLVFISIASALYYGINSTRLGYSFTSTLNRPLVIGLYLGIVFGDIPQCMILAGSIQALYIGMMGSGGIIPSDASLATIVASPIARLNGLDATTAISLALPVGLLGSILVNVRYMINGLFVSRAEACADACDGAGIIRNASLYPALVSFLMYFPIVFVSVFFGTGFVENVVAAIPEWLSHGLSVAGGWLPAIGFALTIMVIDQPKLIPIFIIGFFMVQYLNFGVMACAIFAICISLFVTMRQMDEDERRGGGSEDFDDFDDFDDDAEADAQAMGAVAGAQSGGVIGPRGAAATFLRWYIFCEMSHSYERMQGISWVPPSFPRLRRCIRTPRTRSISPLRTAASSRTSTRRATGAARSWVSCSRWRRARRLPAR
ncbi:MAG: PTS sugar transporter subunit IIC [Atopobiaceae bacterium]|nr:PTS sugar transporter subunit IIC [Atopobiaceae bacterium]